MSLKGYTAQILSKWYNDSMRETYTLYDSTNDLNNSFLLHEEEQFEDEHDCEVEFDGNQTKGMVERQLGLKQRHNQNVLPSDTGNLPADIQPDIEASWINVNEEDDIEDTETSVLRASGLKQNQKLMQSKYMIGDSFSRILSGKNSDGGSESPCENAESDDIEEMSSGNLEDMIGYSYFQEADDRYKLKDSSQSSSNSIFSLPRPKSKIDYTVLTVQILGITILIGSLSFSVGFLYGNKRKY